MILGLLNQMEIFLQLYLIELSTFHRPVALELLHLYSRLSIGVDILFTDLRFMEFWGRYLILFHLFSVIDCFKRVLDGKSSQNIPLLMEFLKASFLLQLFFYYTFMTFLMMLSVILLSMLMILISTLSVNSHLICDNNWRWPLNLNLIYVALWTGARSGLLISNLEKLSLLRLTGLITLVLWM